MYVYMYRWAISVECVCVFVSPHCLASCWAVGEECVCVSSLAGLLLGRRCSVRVCVTSPADLLLGHRCGVSSLAGLLLGRCVCLLTGWTLVGP